MAVASDASFDLSCPKKYEVFISFRGEDTRNTFTSHLYTALCRKKIKTYIDEESLNKGAEISPALLKAIEESKLSVIIFSPNYASSSWCLDELNHILKCKQKVEQLVVPVFYHVDPSHVRKQNGSFEAAFARHEERFKDKEDKVHQWRISLTEAANLSGWHLSDSTGSESELIEAIVKDIIGKLNGISPVDNSKGLVGIDKRVSQIEMLMDIGSPNVRIIGLWGMGGIGKTTLARVVFDRNNDQFESCYFFENVREESNKNGVSHLQMKLFSELLEESDVKTVSRFVKERLRRTKVLIVLDDINDLEQVDYLAGNHDWFGKGSRIIVTTRDVQLLKNIGAHDIYPVEELNFDEAHQLFCSSAFRGNFPATDPYKKLSERAVNYAQGLPLALKILGSHLYSKSTKEWESELNKLKMFRNSKVQNVLRVSYDGLDPNEKDIFLDIACFFKGEHKDSVERILDGCNFFVDTGVRTLIDRCLITVTPHKKFEMHELVQQMGWDMVCQEFPKESGKRSRLWSAQDSYHVLKYNTGTSLVEGIFLDMSQVKNPLYLKPTVFEDMYNLRLLKIYDFKNPTECKAYLPEGLRSLPDELRYLRWDNYPLESLPSSFTPQKLVQLDMCSNNLKELLHVDFESLKVLNLSFSKNITQIPDFSLAPNLERIFLNNCEYLENLGSSLCNLQSLQSLSLSGCSCIDMFPELPTNIKCLDLQGTAIEQVPSSVQRLSYLEVFDLRHCRRLRILPTSICNLSFLKSLLLRGCSMLEYFPEILKPMERLEDLELSESGIRELPSSIDNLSRISSLYLHECKNLKFVPNNIYNTPLHTVSFSGCPRLEYIPSLSTFLHSVTTFHLKNCNIFEIPDLLFLPSLEELKLEGIKIDTVPTSIKKCCQLYQLFVVKCPRLRSLPELPCTVLVLYVTGCTSLETFPNTLIPVMQCPLEEDVDFMFYDCWNLDRNVCDNLIRTWQNRILYKAAKVKLEVAENEINGLDVSFCCPGNEIPKWFNYQVEGSSLNIKLPHQWYNNNFLGFAMCAVAAFEGNCSKCCHPLNFRCKFYLKRMNGEISNSQAGIHNNYPDQPDNATFSNLDHVHIFYVHEDFSGDSDAVQASFDFFSNAWGEPGKCLECNSCKVKRCGVRILYLEDAEEMGIVTNNDQYLVCESNAIVLEPAELSGVVIDLNMNASECNDENMNLNSRENLLVGKEVSTFLSSSHSKGAHANTSKPGPSVITDAVDFETDEPHLKRAKFSDSQLLPPR